MRRPDGYVKKRTPQIHNTETGLSVDLGGEVPDEGEGEGVADGLEVQRPEVGTRPDSSSCLICKVKATSPISLGAPLNLLYDPVLKHLLPDSPAFGGLFRVSNHWPPFSFHRGIIRGFNLVKNSMAWVFCESRLK